MFKKKAPLDQTDRRNSPIPRQGQRVNSYYTASKKQITTFQRHTDVTQRATRSFAQKAKRYGLITLVSVLLVVALIAMFTLNKSASITIDGGEYRSPEAYQQIVATALAKSFKNNLKLSLDSTAVEQAIREQLPEAYAVAVYAPLFGRSPEVTIKTAAPFAVLLQTDGPTLIMGDRGRLIIEVNAATVDTSKLSTITNQSGTIYTAGDQLFKPEEMTALQALQFQYTKGTGEGGVAYILPLAPREIHTKEGTYIAKFSLGSDMAITQQYGALRAVQAQLQSQGKTPTEYIDVRLATKVFIK